MIVVDCMCVVLGRVSTADAWPCMMNGATHVWGDVACTGGVREVYPPAVRARSSPLCGRGGRSMWTETAQDEAFQPRSP